MSRSSNRGVQHPPGPSPTTAELARGTSDPAVTADPSATGSIVGIDTPLALSDDPGLYSRRDQTLALRLPGTLAQSESWEPAPAPDVSSWQRITLSGRPESYIFFRDEHPRSEHHNWRYRR